MAQTKTQLSKEQAVDKLWRNGILHWKLDSCQKQLYNTFHKSKYRKIVWKASRRLGKSFALLIIALEFALQNPGAQIKYACPTAVMAQKIIIPTIRKILEDCPKDIKPDYIKSEKVFNFKNNSIIQIEGTDEGNAEKLRGTESHLSILDEAGFMDDLEYVINDILLPQTLTTRGKIILSSTPPRKPDHPYNKFAAEAQLNDAYIKKTIMDAVEDTKNDPPHIKNRFHLDILEEIKQSVGGETSATWQREFMCNDIVSDDRLVIPEFDNLTEAMCVKDWEAPKRRDRYVSMDIGFVDFTGILFAYLDYNNGKLVIEDEGLLNGMKTTSTEIAKIIKDKEAALWQDPTTKLENPPYMRVSDDDLIVLKELQVQHKLQFSPTRKDGKEAAIDDLRNKIRAQKIIIHPRCKNLIFQLKTATWNKKRTSFERTENEGHYDLVDALVYMVRNVQWQKNPYGLIHGVAFDVFDKGQVILSETAESFKSVFNIKPRNRNK
jgi:hypothetical protein